ncbi:MAG: hypothetical protein CO189_08575 [candidate division Zixibacteria bacterium CG_4_9_14_3_um_filter_46_8]|nr:MAG: hypothetical protein CO189_08575 [candidate division Zixibacteria bacterium CG_4_9_14_3_um_filter_46_8]
MNRELDLQAKTVHEAIDLQVQKEGLKSKPLRPIIAPVLAKAHTPIYKMHRYYARRPHNVFSKMIEHYSNPGDIILDPFCGGGVTVVEALKLRRRVVGIDLNPLATWITQVEASPIDIDAVEKAFQKWFDWSKQNIETLFRAKCTKCGKSAVAEWFEWSNVIKCPDCKSSVVLGNATKHPNAVYECTNPKCKARLKADDCERLPDKMLSVLVNCENCEERRIRPATIGDIRLYNSISKTEKSVIKKEKLVIPKDDFPDMNSVRENNLYNKGFLKFADYFTPRQRISLGLAKKWIRENVKDESIKQGLIHIFSASIRFVNKMVIRSEAWRGDRPLEWPGHIYWPPYTYLEASPIDPMRKRFAAFKAGKAEQEREIGDFCSFPRTLKPWEEIHNGATCWILTQSSHEIKLPDASIDAVITDPPFGGNVQYAELSDFYLVWIREFLGLKNGAPKENEAIETRHSGFDGAKDRKFYEDMLFKIFKECRRVIKPDGWMALTFHNRDIGVWMAMNRAAIRAGFRLPSLEECRNRGMVYQPPIENYTQTIHQKRTGSMLGDFILSFKPYESTIELEAIKEHLSTDEEKSLLQKCEQIIRYHGGADETTLMTGLLPYLSEKGLLARLAKFDLRLLLSSGNFIFDKKEKKWFMVDMVEPSGAIKFLDSIPAENLAQQLIFSHLSEHTKASLDELLVMTYSQLVNSYRPQMSTIDKVLTKYCKKLKTKGQKREFYILNPRAKTPGQINQAIADQIALDIDIPILLDHNGIIKVIAETAKSRGYNVHIGETEQRKSPMLNELSLKLSGFEVGLTPNVFRLVKEIDLIILTGSQNILSAIEVATSITTFNKAINDRFRNLTTIAPNLNILLNVVIADDDFSKAHQELYTPANIESNLASKVRLLRISEIGSGDFLDKLLGSNP